MYFVISCVIWLDAFYIYSVKSEVTVALSQTQSSSSIRVAPLSKLSDTTNLYVGKTTGLEFDPVEGRLYYADKDTLSSRDAKGRDFQEHKINADKIAIDSKHALLFYTSSKQNEIGVLSLYEYHHQTIFKDSDSLPDDITLDVEQRHIYWLNKVNGSIERIVYDGSSRETITSNKGTNGLVLNVEDQRLYFGVNNVLRSCDLNGEDQKVAWLGKNKITSIKMFQNNIYIVNQANKDSVLVKYDVFNKTVTTLLTVKDEEIADVALLDSNLEPIDDNNCTINYGDCLYFCLPLPDNNQTCITPEGEKEPDIIDRKTPPPDSTITYLPEVPVPTEPTEKPKTGAIVGDSGSTQLSINVVYILCFMLLVEHVVFLVNGSELS